MVKIFGWFVWNNREINKKKKLLFSESGIGAAGLMMTMMILRQKQPRKRIFKDTSCPHTASPPPRIPVWRSTSAGRFPGEKKIINLGQILKNPMRNWQHFYVQHFHANYSSWISTSIKNADTWWIGKVTIILLTIFIFLSFCQISLSMNGIIRKLTRGATGGIVLLLHFSLHPLDVSI